MTDQKEMKPEEELAVLRGKVAALATFGLLIARMVLPDGPQKAIFAQTLKNTNSAQLGFVNPVGEKFVEAFQLGLDEQLADLGKVLEKNF